MCVFVCLCVGYIVLVFVSEQVECQGRVSEWHSAMLPATASVRAKGVKVFLSDTQWLFKKN